MGGTTGKLSHLGFAKEVVFGTAVGATTYLKYSSESISKSIEDLVEASLNAVRDEGNSYEGLGTIAGDTVHEVHPAGLGHLLRASLGAPVSTDLTGSYRHVFTPLATRNRATGTAIATTNGSQITVTGTPYAASEHVGRWVHVITGSGAGAYGEITANTTSVLTVTTSPAAAATDTFEILDGPENCVLPPYTIESHKDLAGATPAFQFAGCALNNLSFTVAVGAKILGATASWIGKSVTNIANTTPSLPSTNPWTWDQLILGVGLYTSGTATGGSASTLVDTGKTWATNALAGYLCYITGATGANQVRKIASNNATTLTLTPDWTTAAASGSTYKIFYADNLSENLTFGWSNGMVGIPLLNNSKNIARIVSDAFRTGTISRTVIPEQITDFSTYYNAWTTREWLLYFHGAQITGAHYYDLIFYFPKTLFTVYPINIGGAGRLTVATGMKTKFDSTLGYSVKCILQNGTSSY